MGDAEPVQTDQDPQQQEFQKRVEALETAKQVAEEQVRLQREELDRERTERLRLETLLRTPQSEPESVKLTTAEDVQAAYSEGKIDDAARIRLLVHLESAQVEAASRRRDAEEGRLLQAADALTEFKVLIPDLNKPGSPILQSVSRTYARLVARGFPEDLRTQLTALETVAGDLDTLKARRTVGDYTAEQGAGSHWTPSRGLPPENPESSSRPSKKRGEVFFEQLTPSALADFRAMGWNDEQIKADLDFAEETTLRRYGRLK